MVLSLKCKIDVSYFQLLLCLRLNSVYLGYPVLFSSHIHIKIGSTVKWFKNLENSGLGKTQQTILVCSSARPH